MEGRGQPEEEALVQGECGLWEGRNFPTEGTPSSSSLPEQESPLKVVQDFVAAANSGSIRREFGDDCILSFFGRNSRGGAIAASYFRARISSHYQHEGFNEAAFVSPAKAEILKARFMRSFSWVRRNIVEQKLPAPSLHLRAESDDDETPSNGIPAHLRTPPRPASEDLDQLKFVEANGILKSLGPDDSKGRLSPRKLQLTLGYRLVPLGFSHGNDVEICLAVYDKHSADLPSAAIPRSGSARNPPTDDEAEDDSRATRSARRTLFFEDNDVGTEADPPPGDQRHEQDSQQEQQVGVEASTQEEAPQPPAAEEPPCPSISSYTPRKRHSNTSGGEVEPKRTPGRNRLRF